MNEIRIGSIIRKHTGQIVRVTNIEDDIKNGRPGYDGDVLDTALRRTGDRVWGYTDAIEEVLQP